MRSLEDMPGRHVEVWRIPGRFTKNPDLIRFPSGRMMLVFCNVEKHWTEEVSRITTIESVDNGKTWTNPRVIAEADRRKGEERWLTPRLSLLRDGGLVIICDHDDYAHYHEDQAPGIWIWFSADEGRTWSEPQLTGVPGLEPDRVVELQDGTLLIASCMVFRDTQKEGMFVMRSRDGGKSWTNLSVIAKGPVHNYTEGAIAIVRNGVLACVMRDENHNGYASPIAFSLDEGRTWSAPQSLPFSGDRPYVKALSDGRTLVTYRNQCGNTGTHAWLGDITRDLGHQIGARHYGDKVTLEPDALHIHNQPRSETRYLLLPPESYRSDVVMDTTLRVTSPGDLAAAAMEISRFGISLHIGSNTVWLHDERDGARKPGSDSTHKVDMTSFHRIRLQVRKGLVTAEVDGNTVIYKVVRDEVPLRQTWFGKSPECEGDVWFRDFTYYHRNQTETDHLWVWQASLGQYPDQYQLDHILELYSNPPLEGHSPDNGYSSWVELPDGRIFLVDYTNRGDPIPTAHLYGAYFSPKDFSS